ncbi:RnfABCDGE type electron transport complex subunit D [Thiohalomonas denitrificans]|uniref:Ion-translocating oxidoreductase complex subunit D n=1 Tax=Thiohalomonas denitrificans TaxID=415747 RepID=A0A1G5PI28_9GAMM|nr:RnfABCDGE type electron transport complex subunit D [Thiohalomonas denitrificans]SCZ49127.1 electron transport complex protein RnfD [Thiohalomonas denitrificans]
MVAKVELKTSPHLRSAPSVEQIMRNVVYALLPIVAFAIYQFGLSALVLTITVVASCLGTERLFNWLSGKPSTLSDWSAVITGLLLALTLPPAFPLWMGAVAGFAAIAIGKALFGGLGFNVFNPALVGRAFVQAAFPVAISTWTPAFAPGRFMEFIPSTLALPFMKPPAVDDWVAAQAVDTFTGATPLAQWKFDGEIVDSWSLFSGMTTGSSGETSALLILVCGAYLALRRMMNWQIPAAMLLGAALTALPFWLYAPETYPSPVFVLFSGGLMLGAVFMASDMVASPVTPRGLWIYGLLMGFLTVVIRFWGGLPEGVMYAILLGNAASPLIESITQPRIYGERKG